MKVYQPARRISTRLSYRTPQSSCKTGRKRATVKKRWLYEKGTKHVTWPSFIQGPVNVYTCASDTRRKPSATYRPSAFCAGMSCPSV